MQQGNIIGVTGRLGSGKSFVCRALCKLLNEKQQKCRHIDFDDIRRDILGDPTFEDAVHRPIVKLFGAGVQSNDRSINRSALSKIIFSKQEALLAFEEIIDPVIVSELYRRLRVPYEIVFVESALLLEKQLLSITNFNLIVVHSSEKLRWTRLKDTVGDISKEELEARLALQLPDGEHEKRYRKISMPGSFFAMVDNGEEVFTPTLNILASKVLQWAK